MDAMQGYSHHNTTHETGKTLTSYEGKAKSQETRILNYMKTFPRDVSPTFVQEVILGGKVPITSARRALTNLTNHGDLVKSTTQVKGRYGRMEHLWKLPPTQQRLF